MAVIRIEQWPQPVEAKRQRILEAALDAGVPFPHGCGSGECGSCKCELLSGRVDSDRCSPDALSAEEAARGLILACRSRPLGDVSVRWLSEHAPLPMVRLDARVAALDMLAPDVVRLRLDLADGKAFPFRAGQFAKLRFARLPARSYSMANPPGQRALEFHIRVFPEGRVSPVVATQVAIGDPVEVRGPFGDAHWAGACNANLLLVAGGTGLAPILSVLDSALRDGHRPEQIHLYHGVRTARDLYAGEELIQRARAEGWRFVPVFSEDRLKHARSGHVHEAVADDFDSLASGLIHVAGPPPMVEAVKALAARRGAAPSRVKADAFVVAEPEKRSLWERITNWGETTLSGL
jgi:CDP-4-dehydro-6-deoxyglucose reductase/ferredoxin-NAD(P)+ reductase (naphthalene dioxygenase ferredoxin-specific)